MKKSVLIALAFAASVLPLRAEGPSTSAGLTLAESASPRASALGEAFSAVGGDISAFAHNPASLDSLKEGQASFIYNRGLTDDAFGRFSIGGPSRRGGVGLSVGYYTAGDVDLFDGTSQRNVSGQKDLAVAVGYAGRIGAVRAGGAVKYLSSEIVERYKASAFALDLGAQLEAPARVTLGAALQNLGTALKYVDESSPLPRTLRLGAAWRVRDSKNSPLIMAELPYRLVEKDWRPGLGVEAPLGPLALRAGYRSGAELEGLSFGTGFLISSVTIDYSFSLVDRLDNRHRVGVTTRFGGMAKEDRQVVELSPRQAAQAKASGRDAEEDALSLGHLIRWP